MGDAPLELGGACEAQRRVTAAGIVEAIIVTGQRVDGLGSRLALQLRFWRGSDSLRHHDSRIMDVWGLY